MGRKDRNKISKNNDDNINEDEFYNDNNIIDDTELQEKIETDYNNIIWNLKTNIQSYIETNALPICQHLNMDSLEQFIYSLEQ